MIEEKNYTCKDKRIFKEIFSNPNNSDLLKAVLENILKEKIKKIENERTDLKLDDISIQNGKVEALLYTDNKKIDVDINSENSDYIHTKSMSYLCQKYIAKKSYDNQRYIVQINLVWGLGSENEKEQKFMIANKDDNDILLEDFIIYEINMDYYNKIWNEKDEDEIKENLYIIMLGLDKNELESIKKDNIVNKYIKCMEEVIDNIELSENLSSEDVN